MFDSKKHHGRMASSPQPFNDLASPYVNRRATHRKPPAMLLNSNYFLTYAHTTRTRTHTQQHRLKWIPSKHNPSKQRFTAGGYEWLGSEDD